MPTTHGFSISPQVHRALYQTSIYNFLKSNIKEFKEFEIQENLNRYDELYHSRLLDRAIEKGLITKEQTENFLIRDLNYGTLKNLYIYFFQDTYHLENIENVKNYIKSLNRFYHINENFAGFPFMYFASEN